jgi:hypothetical protein
VAARGRGRGGQGWGKRGVGGQEKGKIGGATTRVLWEEELTPQMSLDFASNGPQLFPHIHAPKINLWQHFLGYYSFSPQSNGSLRPHKDHHNLVSLALITKVLRTRMGKKESDPSDKNSNEHENLSLTSH